MNLWRFAALTRTVDFHPNALPSREKNEAEESSTTIVFISRRVAYVAPNRLESGIEASGLEKGSRPRHTEHRSRMKKNYSIQFIPRKDLDEVSDAHEQNRQRRLERPDLGNHRPSLLDLEIRTLSLRRDAAPHE